LSLLNRNGLAGMFVYLIGHGLVKGAMFMVAGILLAELASIGEIGLRGLGKEIWPVGVAMGLGGLLLAGLPLGLLGMGTDLIEAAAHDAGMPWVIAVVAFGAACTGGAVLRATGRIFFGWGAVSGDEERAPTEEEQEKADRPLWLMLLPTVLLLMMTVVGGHAAQQFGTRAALPFMQPDNAAVLSLATPKEHAFGASPPPPTAISAWISVASALWIAAFNLGRETLPKLITETARTLLHPIFAGLQALHSGLIGDYIAWLAVGLALFTAAFMLS
jgi:multicomponent Na+:H+ antiporter subunit D